MLALRSYMYPHKILKVEAFMIDAEDCIHSYVAAEGKTRLHGKSIQLC